MEIDPTTAFGSAGQADPAVEIAGRDRFSRSPDRAKVEAVVERFHPAIADAIRQVLPDADLPPVDYAYIESAFARFLSGIDGKLAYVPSWDEDTISLNVPALAALDEDQIANVLVHEHMHVAAHDFSGAANLLGRGLTLESSDADLDGLSAAQVMIEGGAEYFASQVAETLGLPDDGLNDYVFEEEAFAAAVEIVGEDTARRALFTRDGPARQAVFAAVAEVFSRFDDDKAGTCSIDGDCSPFRED